MRSLGRAHFPSSVQALAVRTGATRYAVGANMGATAPSNAENGADIAKLIGDSHCHAHLDPRSPEILGTCQAPRMALMGVSSEDWLDLQLLAEKFPDKVQPCFGIHPWKAHLHASSVCSGAVADALDPPLADPQELATSLQQPLIAGWRVQQLELLKQWPHAIVGEIGIDRAAKVPGTASATSYDHQWSLFKDQMNVAADLGRPVSLHCVKAYGHLRDYLQSLDPAAAPPRIMLHSYGGSPELVREFTAIGGGGPGSIGARLFFSFAAILCRRGAKKAAARVAAVPPERLLLESDLTEVAPIDAALVDIVAFVAEATGRGEEEVVRQAQEAFDAFYGRPYVAP